MPSPSRQSSTRGIGWTIAFVGAAALLAALGLRGPAAFADLGSHFPNLQLGVQHWPRYLYGVGVVAVGLALSLGALSPDGATRRRRAALMLVAWSAAYSATFLAWPRLDAEWVLLGYVAALCALLPSRVDVLTLAGVAGLHLLLTWVIDIKSGLTGLPLTVLDLRIALSDPSAVWAALGLPQWTGYVALALVAVLWLTWLAFVLVEVVRLLRRRATIGRSRAVKQVLAACAIVLLIIGHFGSVFAGASEDKSTWDPKRLTGLAHRMGSLPFLAYSYHLESRSSGDIYRESGGAAPPSSQEVSLTVRQYIDFDAVAAPKAGLSPNIVVVLAESTFDPGAVFRLEGAWNDALFRRTPRTAANGSLRVNAAGGGTWISEFETIVGLDSRLFGYSGMYTHASLSPYVDRSFAMYLRDFGYRTAAFFPVRGDFYNARNAYADYGFEKIYDSEMLGLGRWVGDDRAIAASVEKTLGAEPDSPFFAYALFLENHSPHDCQGTDPALFTVRFADTADFAPNCALHDYVRRLGSTTRAIESLLEYLARVQARSGRPFVLLAFGDHQPYTFTDTGDVQYDYRPLRRHPGNAYTTFFHIYASSPGRKLRCCQVAPPAAVLPTLLSGFVAGSPEQVYLGINLWLYDRCGSDAVRLDFGHSLQALSRPSRDGRTPACKGAYQRALAGYRTSGTFRLGDATNR
ncbi:MAG TPA: sulfatase-like hydrolase/transferase [Steroidobacteraceae bacterium]|nr:sulfatase-like hydrolase/transferase [Steroidobacteraceae bacterium]